MKCIEFFNKYRKADSMLVEFVTKLNMTPVYSGESNFGFDVHYHRTPETQKLQKVLDTLNLSAVLDLYCRAKVSMEGLKIFRPQADNLEALEQMEIRVKLDEYQQPFPSLVIEFPENYTNKKIVKNPLPGLREDSGIIAEETHSPSFVIVHRDPGTKAILLCLYYNSTDVYTTVIYQNIDIEDSLDRNFKGESYDGSLQSLEEEKKVSKDLFRTALNCILVMEEMGIKKLGPDNPAYYAKLERRIKKSHPKHDEANRQELFAHPIIYSFDQNIKLYNVEREHIYAPSDQHSGRTVKSHWRRGCWVNQPYGPKQSLRKRIRRPPVLVNQKYFHGKVSDTTVTYNT